MGFDGLNMGLGSIAKLSDAKTRMVTAENVYGEKGRGGMAELSETPQPEVAKIGQQWDGPNAAARDLGRKWKVRPCITVPAGRTATIMDIEGPGTIQHVWVTVSEECLTDLILRVYWDDEQTPSVEAPLGHFFCLGWKKHVDVLALPINVNPSRGMNCYFPMPFRARARVTVENRAPRDAGGLFYAITYALGDLAGDEACFHAQYRRANPLPYMEDYTIVDGIAGRGHYVGTYMAWQQNSTGWWGEGEIKFFLDGDDQFPTLCGTGTEDYFCGAWGFAANFSAPFVGYPQGACDGRAGNRHGLYRFHVMDPIRFQRDLKVTMQAIGWRSEGRYLPLQDDISSVAYWYQAEPHAAFPALPGRDEVEVV